MGKHRRRLSYDWIAEELAQAFQLPLLSVPVQLGAQAFSRLAHHQQQKRTSPRRLSPHLWHAARQEACSFCIQTLAHLIKVTESPESLSDEQVQLYEEFLKTVREYLETPPPPLSEPLPQLSPSEQMRYEQQLWRHAREALELCERWRKALSQNKVPEDGACGASGCNLRARRKAQP